MKEYDCVELLVEKEQYAKHGIHKGMQGCICYDKSVANCVLVEFSLYGEGGCIATISVQEADLRVITEGDDWINDRIRAEHKKE